MLNTTTGKDLYPFETSFEVSTLVELLRLRASQNHDDRAYTFLADGETKELTFTYGELDLRARAIGAELQSIGARGERVILLYEAGLDYLAAFFGCLYAGAIAVPAYPPRLKRRSDRLDEIILDSSATIALTTDALLSKMRPLIGSQYQLNSLRWVRTDIVSGQLAEQWNDPGLDTSDIAFLQYTSGSTSTPRGVVLTHNNLLDNQRRIQRAFQQDERSIILSWLPLYHDMGLIGTILQPLYSGARCIIFSPMAFLEKPIRWLQAISKYKVTTSGGPNFAYDLCVRKIEPQQREQLDLSSWRVAFNGAEPVRAETLNRFAEAFKSCGFRREALAPCYGLAEATLLVCGGKQSQGPVLYNVQPSALHRGEAAESFGGVEARTLVGCGQIEPGQQIAIVDPEARLRCRDQQVGEIWVSSPSIANGYWGRSQETDQTFRAYLADTNEGPFLRTGDLGFIREGQLYVTGRLKDLIIIRGKNHYPQDIELTVEQSCNSLRPGCGAAFSVEVEGEERLIVAQEVDRPRNLNVDSLAQRVRESVAREHEVQVYAILFLKPGGMPKTSSGKIQRQICRARYLSGTLGEIAHHVLEESDHALEENATGRHHEEPSVTALKALPPQERQQSIARSIQQQVAHCLRLSTSKIDLDVSLNSLAIDSLQALEIKNNLEISFGVDVTLSSLLQGSSIRQIAQNISANLPDFICGPSRTADVDLQDDGEYTLSAGQKALWFLSQVSPDSVGYNIASAVLVRGELDVPALRSSFQKIVDRHAPLRTTFFVEEDKPVQRVHSHQQISFKQVDASAWSDDFLNLQLVQESKASFDLTQAPLLRLSLFARGTNEHMLLLVIHHIVADFWSLELLIRELQVLYPAERAKAHAHLPPLESQYRDYVRWQAERLAGDEGERLWRYWQGQLSGELPTLNLITDHPRQSIQTYRGASCAFGLDAELVRRIEHLSQESLATVYTLLLAVFHLLLSRYTGQADIIVGSPMTGRGPSRFKNLVGYFVNSVPLRATIVEGESFSDLIKRVRDCVLGALEHQDYPFAHMVERLQPERRPGMSPLFQVMFAMQRASAIRERSLGGFALGEAGASLSLADLLIETTTLEERIVQFDIMLMMAETKDAITASLQYNSDLFDPATMSRMAGHYQALLRAIVADPDSALSNFSILTEAESRQILKEWNETSCMFSLRESMHELFEAQVKRTPDATCLILEEKCLSYQELNRRANQLAHYLIKLGVGPEVLVGVCVERSLEMVVALLAVLKAGGAYVPLDPGYPKERITFMLKDAEVLALLTNWHTLEHMPDQSAHVVWLDSDCEAIAHQPDYNPSSGATANNLAYVIYTSGSTGTPKGVAITHRNAAAMIGWAGAIFSADELRGTMASTSICFDLSVFELFVPLSFGGKVILAENALQLRELAAARQVTLVNTVPSAMAELVKLNGVPSSVRTVNLAGEPLQNSLVQQLYQQDGVEKVYNLYGPSEDTTYSTFALMKKGVCESPSIGRPIFNSQVYSLDRSLQPAPVGVAGELYIGGEGLARGYLRRPELTAERFIANPFSAEPGARLYKTGDLARYSPSGEIDFLGRIDHQVKIRGFRIELGEIEATISKHPAVRDCVVVAGEVTPGNKTVIGYIVFDDASGVGVSELRDHLKDKLPDYMVPSMFVRLGALPLTPNGKVDRRALPAPERTDPELEGAFVLPRNAVEEVIARIWAELLQTERVGVYDDFFQLGGHSLLASRVVSRVRDTLQVDFPLRNFLEAPTVAGLASTIESIGISEQKDFESIAQLWLSIDQLSTEEIESMLGED